jgi:hypothetical protein
MAEAPRAGWPARAVLAHHHRGPADTLPSPAPITPEPNKSLFQLVNSRYERGAMILTSNRGFAEWGEVFGGPVVASALLDRLLHHAIVVRIEGASYRLRRHADLLPETSTARQMSPDPVPRRRGRPPKARPAELNTAP